MKDRTKTIKLLFTASLTLQFSEAASLGFLVREHAGMQLFWHLLLQFHTSY